MQDQDDQKIYLPLEITIHGIYFYRRNPGIVKLKFRTFHLLFIIFDFVDYITLSNVPLLHNVIMALSAGLSLSLRSSIRIFSDLQLKIAPLILKCLTFSWLFLSF